MNNLSPRVHSNTGKFRIATRAFCIGMGCLLLTYSVFFSGGLSGSDLHMADLGPMAVQKRPLPKKEVWFDTLRPRTAQADIAAASVTTGELVAPRRIFSDRPESIQVKHQQPNSRQESRRSVSRLKVNRSVVPSTLVIYAENGVIKTRVEVADLSPAKKAPNKRAAPNPIGSNNQPHSFAG